MLHLKLINQLDVFDLWSKYSYVSLECLRCTTLTSNTPIHKQTDEEEEEDDGPTHTRSKICSFNLHILLYMKSEEDLFVLLVL